MKSQKIKVLALCLVATLTAFACSGGEDNGTEPQSASQPEEKQAAQNAEMTPKEIGQQIGELYIKTMGELVESLKDKPEASMALPNVEVLKEACVIEMVELGRKREALDQAGKAAVDSQIRSKAYSFSKDPVFTSFNDIQQHYFQNRDFHKIVMSFNIITQYANFDLLKKQEPEEAQRLGIE